MNSDIFGQIRLACRQVAHQAEHVEIGTAAIASYAASIPRQRLTVPEMDPACHYLGHGEATVAFLLTLDAINFGSGFFPDIFGSRPSGYFSIAAALKARFEAAGPLSAEELSRLNSPNCADLLNIPTDQPAGAELAALFARALNEYGEFLLERFAGSFQALIDAAGHSAEKLVGLLAGLPCYRDIARCGNISVPFLKRAQITAADLYIAFAGSGPGRFDDIAGLTICADNLVPHVLRWDGILNYRKELAEHIDAGLPVAPGSPLEVEIRACAVHASELILAELLKTLPDVTAMHLDNYLWHRGQQPSFRQRPRHRTKTLFY